MWLAITTLNSYVRYLFIISFIYALCYVYVLTNIPAPFDAAIVTGELLYRLSLALVGTTIFYFITQHLKRVRDKQKVYPVAVESINELTISVRHLREVIQRTASGMEPLEEDDSFLMGMKEHSKTVRDLSCISLSTIVPLSEEESQFPEITPKEFQWYLKRFLQDLDLPFRQLQSIAYILDPETIVLIQALAFSYTNMRDWILADMFQPDASLSFFASELDSFFAGFHDLVAHAVTEMNPYVQKGQKISPPLQA